MTQKAITKNAYCTESPLFEIKDECGYPGSSYVVMVVAQAEGDTFTLGHTFEPHEMETAVALCKRINEHQVIDTRYWVEGDPWSAYREPQSYEDEKREALEREYWD